MDDIYAWDFAFLEVIVRLNRSNIQGGSNNFAIHDSSKFSLRSNTGGGLDIRVASSGLSRRRSRSEVSMWFHTCSLFIGSH